VKLVPEWLKNFCSNWYTWANRKLMFILLSAWKIWGRSTTLDRESYQRVKL